MMTEKKVDFDYRKTLAFVKKHSIWFVLLVAILLQFVPNAEGSLPWGGIWMRMQNQKLPTADKWAQQSIDNNIRTQVETQVRQKYPNLPSDNLKKAVDEELAKVKIQEADNIAKQKEQIIKQIKSHWQYELNGKPALYMPDIDPYHYLRYARNIEEKGHPGDEVRDGVQWDNHKTAPDGGPSSHGLHSYTLFYLYKIFSALKGLDLMQSAALFPIVFILISLIPAFFIGRRLGGDLGGFFSVILVGLLPSIMARTPWGHADTDAYNVFFPLVIIWLVTEAFYSKNKWKSYGLTALAAVSAGIYSLAWKGWFFTFDLVLIAMVAYASVLLVSSLLKKEQGKSWLSPDVIQVGKISAIFLIISGIVSSLVLSFGSFIDTFSAPFRFTTTLKTAAVKSLWPNVLTTVAELNPGSFEGLISSSGGVALFLIALLGLVLLITQDIDKKWRYYTGFFVWYLIVIKTWNVPVFIAGCAVLGLLTLKSKNKKHLFAPILLLFWFAATLYASIKGVRFTLLAGPAFAVATGAGAALLCSSIANWAHRNISLKKIITLPLLILLFGLIIVNPVQSGAHAVKQSYTRVTGDVPLVNDAWWDVLTKIKEGSEPGAIITSWWDFGHHFKFIADRRVTFDGASQTSPRAHWIGRALLTDNEKEAVGILRMLDCGGTKGYDKIFEEKGDVHTSIKIAKEIIPLDREEASEILNKENLPLDILDLTHCSPPENYFITSGDMVGKAGVWGHFGLWNFEKAEIWNELRHLSEKEAISLMVEKFGYSQDKAERLFREVKQLSSEETANGWIADWPQYAIQPSNCKGDKVLDCGRIAINTTSKHAEVLINNAIGIPQYVAMVNTDGSIEKVHMNNSNAKIGVFVWPTKEGMTALAASPELATSIFSRLYYANGYGLKHFKPFAEANQLVGGKISVWKVDWTGGNALIDPALKPHTIVEDGATVGVTYIGWLNDQTIFDSSIKNWKDNNITPTSSFDDYETAVLKFKYGKDPMIPGFVYGIKGMEVGDQKTITVEPEDAYGNDPSKHELGNKTLHFKIKIKSIQ